LFDLKQVETQAGMSVNGNIIQYKYRSTHSGLHEAMSKPSTGVVND